MPRYVALADADNELLADLDNVLSVDSLAHQLRGRPVASLVEATPPERLCATGPEGTFASQILVPFVRSPDHGGQPGNPPPGPREPGAAARRFPPASEWLYAKLYTGPATADRVLERAAPVVQSALSSGVADRWFFLRYGDPEWHLRLRIHGDPDRLAADTVPLLHRVMAPLLATGEVWRLQFDTYEREVERYGGPQAIEAAEQLFAADSAAALAIVRDLAGDRGAALRWRAALLGIELLFDDLGLSLAARRAVARRAREGYGRELGAGRAFQREVGLRYRQERSVVERLLDPGRQPPVELATSVEALRRRSAGIAPPCAAIRALAEDGALTTDLPDLAMSVAHMHVNRVLRSAQRAQELVLYEMLDRVYSSRAARRGS
jgi:thiopeptide-type bacteriocin biosynthesis protein